VHLGGFANSKGPAWVEAKRAPAEKTVLAEPALVIEASAARDEKR
jgi:hypothetical protein